MIFVTVGTHEQPFNRLIKSIDELVFKGVITEEVFIQRGYSTFVPNYCNSEQFLPFKQMWEFVEKARIVITHGGPSSFIMPLQVGKIPIVVPRQAKFNEHVNNHQVEFAEQVAKRKQNIIVVENISTMGYILQNYDDLINNLQGDLVTNNQSFNDRFTEIVNQLFKNTY